MISIIMPTRNRPHFLREAINAILWQDYTEWELIIVDGGAPSQIPSDPRIRYLVQDGTGIIPAVNQGLSVASGRILNWSNDDDLMAPGTLKWVSENLTPPWLWTYGKCKLIDADGNQTGIGEFGGEPWDLEAEKVRNLCPQPSVFWRRELTEKLGGFDATPEMDLAADWDYWIRLGEIRPPLVTQRIQASYRQWDGSITVARRGEQDQHAEAVRRKHG